MDRELRLGFSSYNFLIYIAKHEGASQRELCQILVIDEALATRTMKKLEQQGFIVRKKSGQVQHSYELYLTEKGKNLAAILKRSLNLWWESLTEDFELEQSALLMEQLQKMAEKAIEKNRKESKS